MRNKTDKKHLRM